jgi:hypothetical protein
MRPKKQHRSQTNRVLDLLQARRGDWVPAYQVAAVGGLQYGVRVHTLRQLGHVIANRVEHHDGQVLSWFRLELPPEPSSQELHEQSAEVGEALFPDWEGEHRDNG